MATAIFERLLLIEGQMRLVAPAVKERGSVVALRTAGVREYVAEPFAGIVLVTGAGRAVPILGNVQEPPALTEADRSYLASGRSLLTARPGPGGGARIFMSRALDPEDLRRGTLIAEINTAYLWDVDAEAGSGRTTRFCVLDDSGKPLFCTANIPAAYLEQVARRISGSAVGELAWSDGGAEYLARYSSIFLQPVFRLPKWTVVLSESRDEALAPVERFRNTFLLVILLALWIVLFLSVSQIRRSLVPLERLKEGTGRIAKREFDARVMVTSGDEFEELAESFNAMAGRLAKQFQALSTAAEIDQAILGALDAQKIVDTLLTRMRDIVPCDWVCVALVDGQITSRVRIFMKGGMPSGETMEEVVQLPPEEVRRLQEHPYSLAVASEGLPSYLAPLARRGASAIILPVFLKGKLSAIIALGYRGAPVHVEEDVVRARQLADQVAVALSNAGLIEELERLHWGTLQALARAIDAKSPWTAGHSERVTDLALHIGWVMGLSQKDIDVLHRGGLLHDIGKLGIPPDILDKPGKLTAEEFEIMHQHVRIGARILEPIAAYANILPIVLQHHERYDGGGYLDGLAGDAINLGARIIVLADMYDALKSDRPYRHAFPHEQAVELIKVGSGSLFDPKVVDAFLELLAMEDKGVVLEPFQPRGAPLRVPASRDS
jgi:putative nucleotidyltransferase with HDIG domain